MTEEKKEEMIVQNTIAIRELVIISKNTTNDIDKLCSRFEQNVPMQTLQIEIVEIKRNLKILHPVFAVLRYPKVVVAATIGLYAFSISDVRHVITNILKFVG